MKIKRFNENNSNNKLLKKAIKSADDLIKAYEEKLELLKKHKKGLEQMLEKPDE